MSRASSINSGDVFLGRDPIQGELAPPGTAQTSCASKVRSKSVGNNRAALGAGEYEP